MSLGVVRGEWSEGSGQREWSEGAVRGERSEGSGQRGVVRGEWSEGSGQRGVVLKAPILTALALSVRCALPP